MLAIEKLKYSLTIIGVLVSLLHWYGIFGFGIDYIHVYSSPNVAYGSAFDRLGWILSSLSIKDYHLGVLVVGLSLTMSARLLVLEVVGIKRISIVLYFITILSYTLMLFTWPYLMSFSNAMRQGLAMSALIFGIYYINTNTLYAFLFLLVSIFLHKSTIFILVLGCAGYYIFKYTYRYSIVLVLMLGILQICLLWYGSLYSSGYRIIGKDLASVWMLLSVGWIFIGVFLKSYNLRKNHFVVVALLIGYGVAYTLGFRWQVERLFMMTVYPMIIIFVLSFKSNSRDYLLLSLNFIFFIFTYTLGMFSALN